MRLSRRRRIPCEIHVPISPTPSFLTRIHYLAASVRTFAGPLSASRIVVTVGGPEPEDLTARVPWSHHYGIEWRWVDRSRFAEHNYYATAIERFTYDFCEPYVLFLDGDTLVTGRLGHEELPLDGGIAGLTAHVSPFFEDLESYPPSARPRSVDFWREIFAAAGLGEPPFVCTHSGWGLMDWDLDRRFCPPYFNLGVLFASREAARAVGREIYAELDRVLAVTKTSIFRCQIALTLAIIRNAVPWSQLPLSLNFPNEIRFSRPYEAQVGNARILHYMRQDEVDRDADFESADTVAALLERPVSNPANRLLLERLGTLQRQVAAESLDR